MYEQEETSLHPSEMAEEMPVAEADAKTVEEALLPRGEGAETTEASVDPEAIDADSAQSADPASEAVESDQTSAAELEYLRRELKRLEEKLESQTR
ncbi:MAG: hypothetical protein IKC59_08765, partial [Clostridia bacterium]|nr:hypothetical protein [Clostridia bacterium]